MMTKLMSLVVLVAVVASAGTAEAGRRCRSHCGDSCYTPPCHNECYMPAPVCHAPSYQGCYTPSCNTGCHTGGYAPSCHTPSYHTGCYAPACHGGCY